MLKRLIFYLVSFIFVFLTINIFPKEISAQQCPPLVVVDKYVCDPPEGGECSLYPRRTSDNLPVNCSMQNNACVSDAGICSSNDTCEFIHDVEKGDWCRCSMSQVDCNLAGGGTPPPGGCTTTAPVITSINWGSPTVNDVTIAWVEGLGGNRHSLRVSDDPSAFTTGCARCVIYNLDTTSPYVADLDLFTPGTTYYFYVVNHAGGGCGKDDLESSDAPTIPPSCTINAPAWGTVTRLTDTRASLSWTPGNPGLAGTTQQIYMGTNQNQVNNNCPVGSSCVVSLTNRPSTWDLYNTPAIPSVLTPGTFYYARIVNYKDATCMPGNTISYKHNCSVTLTPSSNQSIVSGNTIGFTANLTSATTPNQVSFRSVDTSIARVLPTSDGSSPYTTVATGQNVASNQTTQICADVVLWSSVSCSDCTNLTVTPVAPVQGPWWQVIDGDVTTNQEIGSDVPDTDVFIDDGSGGYPGVPVYGTSLSVGNISSLDWNANTNTQNPRTFDYSYFEGLIPEGVTSGETYAGYEWYILSGNTPINLTNFGNRKVIYFIDGDLTINGNITLNDGVGFVGFFVSGDIIINPIVTSMEGIYLTDQDFTTGQGSSQFHLRGSLTALGNLVLSNQRDLANDSNPAEIFEFAPDQILLFPQDLMFKRVKWTEIAP